DQVKVQLRPLWQPNFGLVLGPNLRQATLSCERGRQPVLELEEALRDHVDACSNEATMCGPPRLPVRADPMLFPEPRRPLAFHVHGCQLPNSARSLRTLVTHTVAR